ncbi:uncharacterized protein LOC102373621 [Alligator sinensis]|uniref:Uncharacterized protein LOC102373621 n=1 Tax=Alligator sinensis TaxID=38654 RepID=A0A1U7SWB8_ALLSI|nr:uncharacterized protein LOC102373621 [Alligator sinensis]
MEANMETEVERKIAKLAMSEQWMERIRGEPSGSEERKRETGAGEKSADGGELTTTEGWSVVGQRGKVQPGAGGRRKTPEEGGPAAATENGRQKDRGPEKEAAGTVKPPELEEAERRSDVGWRVKVTLSREGFRGAKTLSRMDFMTRVLLGTLKVDPVDLVCVVAFDNYKEWHVSFRSPKAYAAFWEAHKAAMERGELEGLNFEAGRKA